MTRVIGAAMVAGAAGGCVSQAGTALTPNPAPPPGYRLDCTSYPLGFGAATTHCKPSAPPERIVLRAKG